MKSGWRLSLVGLALIASSAMAEPEQPKRGEVRVVPDTRLTATVRNQRNTVEIYTGKQWVKIDSDEGKRVAKEVGFDLL
jgi:hypothetical protein